MCLVDTSVRLIRFFLFIFFFTKIIIEIENGHLSHGIDMEATRKIYTLPIANVLVHSHSLQGD